jgi:hypothetical protein
MNKELNNIDDCGLYTKCSMNLKQKGDHNG